MTLISVDRSSRIPAILFKVKDFFERVFLVVFFVFSVAFFSYHLLFSNRVIPGVKFTDGQSLSGNTFNEASVLIKSSLVDFSGKPILLKINNQELSFFLEDWGLGFDASESARRAYFVGRSRNILNDLRMDFKALVLGVETGPVLIINDERLDSKIDEVRDSLSVREARFIFENDQFSVAEAREGLDLENAGLREALLNGVKRLSSRIEIKAPEVRPALSSSRLGSFRDRLNELFFSRPSFYYGRKTWEISDQEFLSFFDFNSSSVSAFVLSGQGLKGFTKRVASEINAPPRALSFKAEDDRVLSFESGIDGYVTDEDELLSILAEEITKGSRARLTVPVNLIEPSVSANRYGIKELIGEGLSNFAGSIPGRRHNIEIASEKLNGVLIPPERIFSFNESIGEISAGTGYDYAYIISEGRTVLGTGGGVCQVSTTVFRAALNAGLPILKRTAHAYRVHYYEEGGSPVGFDSTVFAPSVDLAFKNDTGNYILVQSIFEEATDTLKFRFYGTKDGRVVKFEGPVILSASPAPAPLYQEDPGLAKGVVRQVDFAAPGAVVYFKRAVTRNGEKLADDVFYSRYTPWRAIYLVGTRE